MGKPTVLSSELESSRLSFTTLEENERSKGQKIAYPRYHHPTLGEGQSLIIQGCWTKMISYGVPTLGEYYTSDDDRKFLKMPFDMSNPEVVEMVKPLQEIDEMYSTEDFKKENFGKYAKKYTYTPIFRQAQEDEDDDNSKPPYMKLKLNTSWPEGNVTTKVFLTEKLDDGTVKRTLQEVESVTDFATHVRYLCNFRPLFTPVKMWAQQHKMKDPKYGIVFKLIAIEVEPMANSSSSYQNFQSSDLFIDDTNVPTTTIQTSESKVESSKLVQKLDDDDEDEDDSSDESSDDSSDESDEEPVQKVKSKAKGKSKGKKSSK